MRHRLRHRTQFWAKFVTSTLVMNWIQFGYPLFWAAAGAPPAREFPNHKGALDFSAFTTTAVSELVAKGAAARVSHRPTVVSPLNVIDRRGKLRLILDLSYVNSHIDTSGTKFRYETITTATEVVQRDDLMFTIDLESAYHHVDIHPDSSQYLGFAWQGHYYEFRSLPFGLCTAPWVFTKITRELVGRWRSQGIRLLHYLDDFLFAVRSTLPDWPGSPFRKLQRQVLDDLNAAGFTVNEAKLKLDANQQRVFLGFLIDSAAGIIQVAAVRVAELKTALSHIQQRRHNVKARSLAKALGQLASMRVTLGSVGRVFTRALYLSLSSTSSFDHHVRLSANASSEVDFWLRRYDKFNSTPLWPSTFVSAVEIFTDASDFGWGGHTTVNGITHVAQGYFHPWNHGPITSSTLREAWGLEYTLIGLLERIELAVHSEAAAGSTAVRLYVDNQALSHIWAHGSRRPPLNDIMKRVSEFCWQNNILLAVQWVPREENELADYISKFYDGDDWQLNPSVFHYLDTLWGPHDIDVFASHLNHLCPKFYSLFHCPGSAGVDAFSTSWAGSNLWINPPFGLIGRVLTHLRQCSATATLIVPHWPKRPWWHMLCSDGVTFNSFVVDSQELVPRPDLFLPGPKHGNHRPVGNPHWRVFALRIDFRSM